MLMNTAILFVILEGVILSWVNTDRTFNMVDAGPYVNPAKTEIYEKVAEVPHSETQITLPAKKPGTYQFVAVHVDDQGVSSPVSRTATKEITSFKALAGSTVYQVVTIEDGIWHIPMGTLDVDTECDPDQEVVGKYVVPRTNVTWLPNSDARPLAVVADCE